MDGESKQESDENKSTSENVIDRTSNDSQENSMTEEGKQEGDEIKTCEIKWAYEANGHYTVKVPTFPSIIHLPSKTNSKPPISKQTLSTGAKITDLGIVEGQEGSSGSQNQDEDVEIIHEVNSEGNGKNQEEGVASKLVMINLRNEWLQEGSLQEATASKAVSSFYHLHDIFIG